jgi:hypothetical protein
MHQPFNPFTNSSNVMVFFEKIFPFQNKLQQTNYKQQKMHNYSCTFAIYRLFIKTFPLGELVVAIPWARNIATACQT